MGVTDSNTPAARATRREYGIVAFITGLLGLWASAALAIDYINRLTDDDYIAGCDINPIVGCGLFLDTPAASALGIPNIVLGVAAFPVVMTLAAVLLSGTSLRTWIWRCLAIGATIGMGFVIYLQYEAMFVIHGLCPWCLVIWAAMIPLFVHTIGQAGVSRALGRGPWATIVKNRWIIVALWYLIVIGAIMLTLGSDLVAAFF